MRHALRQTTLSLRIRRNQQFPYNLASKVDARLALGTRLER